jgi:aminoglycoside N3'-acetyltransferase
MTATAVTRVHDLLERLGVVRGDTVYLHTSFSRLGHLGIAPDALLDTVLDYLGPSATLVLPCFTWHLDKADRPWKGYADYYRERPVFDARYTPANIGLVPELFRTRPGVRRSVHYWWSVAAHGPLAEDIVAGQERVELPYGPDSAFGRLCRAGATVVGLGVSLNTTSLAPVVDHEIGDAHPQQIMSSTLEEGVVIDHQGRQLVSRSFWLRPEVVRLIKPSVVIERTANLHARMRRVDVGDAIHFAYAFADYRRAALELAATAVDAGTRLPWLEQYPLLRERMVR